MDQIKLLFIDDDFMFASLLIPVMKDAGLNIHYQTSLSGFELAIQGWRPDIILLDMEIDTDENGIDAIRTIKMLAPATPVIIISSHVDAIYETNTFRCGGNDFIKKPILDNAAFIARVKSHIPRLQESTINLGSLAIDRKTQNIYLHSGECIKLTQKELNLIQLLIANKNQIVVYNLIEKCLWPQDDKPETSEHIIHNQMSRLKKYLTKGGITIESIKGIGYKLIGIGV